MSEADKMFEELGYEKDKQARPWHTARYTKATISIIFYSDKTIVAFDLGRSYPINIQELKAINKKCEELGWV